VLNGLCLGLDRTDYFRRFFWFTIVFMMVSVEKKSGNKILKTHPKFGDETNGGL
jgi:hypothetical protein